MRRAERPAGRGERPPPAVLEKRRVEDEAARRIEAWLLRDRRRKVYSSGGRIEAVEEAGGGRSGYVHDRRGDLVRIAEANGRRTAFEYDESRRLTRVAHPDGASTEYVYDDGHLIRVDDRGVMRRFGYDAAGRLTRIQHGNAGASVYRYDARGRITEARTSAVSTAQSYHPDGRVAAVRQSYGGVVTETRFEYDGAGRLAKLWLPGSVSPVCYTWDGLGRPLAVALGRKPLADFEYSDEHFRTRVRLGNGVVEETGADPVDRRPAYRRVHGGDGELLFERVYDYEPEGRLAADGIRRYEYDALERLSRVEEARTGRKWSYLYDARDNRVEANESGVGHRYHHDADNRLVEMEAEGGSFRITYDRFGRPVRKDDSSRRWTYRYDDAGQLLEARCRGESAARFVYDHKGRLVAMRSNARSESYVYGPDDQLLAVTDEHGAPLRLYVWTPLGLLAEIHGSADTGTIGFHHQDYQGARHLVTDESGQVAARWEYDPFGVPSEPMRGFLPMFGNRVWFPEIGMYYFGARWYDPRLGRFLTPDTYTGRPDDERLMHPCRPARSQSSARARILDDWLKQPRVRNRYAFCSNDPVGRTDPNGHWSFGWTLLSVLGAIWTLPNTLFGLLVEITCLLGEVLRWLAWVVSFGNATWESLESPGFDVAASGRLDAFALVFRGGWLGSIPDLLGITFGNVFFVYGKWDQHPHYSGPGVVYPPAYKGKVSIPRNESLYEHELRHTNQYGWFGPFFHLGLPVFGVYLWDVILHGYRDAWAERDAREHSEDAETGTTPPPAPSPGTPAPLPPPSEALTLRGEVLEKTSRSPVANARVDLLGTQLRLTAKLFSYEKPDTASRKVGALEEGDYQVFEILRNIKDADYVRVKSAKLPDGEGWVCSRWKDDHCALLHDKLEKEGAAATDARGEYSLDVAEKRLHRLRFVLKDYFDGESARLLPPANNVETELEAAPNSIQESFLIARIKDFKDFSYVPKMGGLPRYPYQLPGFSLPQAPPKENDCCSFVEGLMVKAWKDARADEFTWSLAKHYRMMVAADDYYSPVSEIADSKMGVEIDAQELPPPWTVVQGWKETNETSKKGKWEWGHTFFIVDVHEDTGRVLTLESTATWREKKGEPGEMVEYVKMHGPGFRMLGDIDEFKDFNPGKDWWKEKDLWTWEKLKEDRPYRKMARLKVHDQRWVR